MGRKKGALRPQNRACGQKKDRVSLDKFREHQKYLVIIAPAVRRARRLLQRRGHKTSAGKSGSYSAVLASRAVRCNLKAAKPVKQAAKKTTVDPRH